MLKKQFKSKTSVQVDAYLESWRSLFLEDMMVVVDDDREMTIVLGAQGSACSGLCVLVCFVLCVSDCEMRGSSYL